MAWDTVATKTFSATSKHEARRVAGYTWAEICATKDTRRLNAWKELGKVNETGRRAEIDFSKAKAAVSSIQLEIAKLEGQVSQIDADIRGLIFLPGEFDVEIPQAARRKVEKLQEQRVKLMRERLDLKAAQANNRMACVKLDQSLQNLRRSQRNLSALVNGNDPAEGPKGGISYVTV